MNIKFVTAAVFVSFILGCSGVSPIPKIEQRAMIDLQCNNLEEIEITDLGKKLYNARGCGETVTYEVSCSVVECSVQKVRSGSK